MADAPKKLTIFDLQAKVAKGEKIFQVTAVDFPTGQLVDRAGIDCILIGDSLGMTALCSPPEPLRGILPYVLLQHGVNSDHE